MIPRLTRRWLLLGAVLGVGCYSPTLPLPPPVKPEISMSETGTYHLQGGVYPDSQVSALNERTLLIDGQQSDHVGLYSFDLKDAQAHDVIQLWYRYANDLSSPVAFELPDLTGHGGTGGGGTSPGIAGQGGESGTGEGGAAP
jgi:hypothetical protein